MALFNVFWAENHLHIEIKWVGTGKEWVAMGNSNSFGSSLFLSKKRILHLQPLKWDKGSYLEQTWFSYCLNSHQYCVRWMVLLWRQKQFLLKQHQWQSCWNGNSAKGVILFLLWCIFMVPSFKNTALIFLEILFIQHFTIFSYKQYDVITDLICIIEKR